MYSHFSKPLKMSPTLVRKVGAGAISINLGLFALEGAMLCCCEAHVLFSFKVRVKGVVPGMAVLRCWGLVWCN